MRISFNSEYLENEEVLENIVNRSFLNYVTDKEDFKIQLLKVLKGEIELKPIGHFPFKYEINELKKEIKIPYFRIQNLSFFIEKEYCLSEYHSKKSELDKLAGWANTLEYVEVYDLSKPVNWESTIIELFGTDKILNPKSLSETVNSIKSTIYRLDKWFLSKLEEIRVAEDVFKLFDITNNQVFRTDFGSLEFYSEQANLRLELFDDDLLPKHAKFWEFAFNPNRINKYGFKIEQHPVFIKKVQPAIIKMKEKFDNNHKTSREGVSLQKTTELNLNRTNELPYFDYINLHEQPKSEFQLTNTEYKKIDELGITGATISFGENVHLLALKEFTDGKVVPIEPERERLFNLFIRKMRNLYKHANNRMIIFDCLEYHLNSYLQKGGERKVWIYNVKDRYENDLNSIKKNNRQGRVLFTKILDWIEKKEIAHFEEKETESNSKQQNISFYIDFIQNLAYIKQQLNDLYEVIGNFKNAGVNMSPGTYEVRKKNLIKEIKKFNNKHSHVVNNEKYKSKVEEALSLMWPDVKNYEGLEDAFELIDECWFSKNEQNKKEPLVDNEARNNEILAFLNFMKPPDVNKEFEKLLNVIRDGRSKLEQYQMIKGEVIPAFKRKQSQPTSFPEYYSKMVELLEEEADIINNIYITRNLDNNQSVSKVENVLNVRDWCVVFYYTDKTNVQNVSKKNRMIAFIKEKKVLNDKGELTTYPYFRKEYYKIEKRINLKEDKDGIQSPPLDPNKIDKILPYLEKNQKALQDAKNDIVYLKAEIDENDKNYY